MPLLEAFGTIYGVGPKLASMALASLLIAAGRPITGEANQIAGAVWARRLEEVIDQADQVAVSPVTDEQIEGEGELIELALAQGELWDRATGDEARVVALLLEFLETAAPMGYIEGDADAQRRLIRLL